MDGHQRLVPRDRSNGPRLLGLIVGYRFRG